VRRRAHGPNNLSGPSSSRPQHPSSELPSRSRARRLTARSPPRSRAPWVRNPHTHSSDRSIKCSDMPRASGSKANPRHTDPLTPPGNHIPTLFRQPSPCGHPWHCRGAVREGRCQLRDTVPPTPVRSARHTPRKRTAEPSKRGTDAYPAPARDDAVTLDQ
jgi:hypothetical protein